MKTRIIGLLSVATLSLVALFSWSSTGPAGATGSQISGSLSIYTPSATVPSGDPYSMVSDPSGNLYYLAQGYYIDEITAQSPSTATRIADYQQGTGAPGDLADLAYCNGTLYAFGYDDNIYTVQPSQVLSNVVWTNFAMLPSYPEAQQVSCDSSGNLYVPTTSGLFKVPSSGGNVTTTWITNSDLGGGNTPDSTLISGNTLYVNAEGGTASAGLYSTPLGTTSSATAIDLGSNVAGPCPHYSCPIEADSNGNLFLFRGQGVYPSQSSADLQNQVIVVPLGNPTGSYYLDLSGAPDASLMNGAPLANGNLAITGSDGGEPIWQLAVTYPNSLGAPTNPVATAGDGQATVSWTAPSSGTPTGYIVTSSPGGKTCTTNGATSCTVTGLTNGTSYTFTVAATADGVTGPASVPSNAVIPTGASASLAKTGSPLGVGVATALVLLVGGAAISVGRRRSVR